MRGVTKSTFPPSGPGAPFGKIGRALGFRWVWYFTLPLPFHPLFLPLALFGIVAWAGFGASGELIGARYDWIALLVVAAIIGIWLSVPVAAWFLLALGGPLIQSVAILGAMALLAVECWHGRVHPAWSVLPVTYFALFLVQSIGGPIWLQVLRKQQASHMPLDAIGCAISLPDRGFDGKTLLKSCDIASVHVPTATPSGKTRRYFWLSPSQEARLLSALSGELPRAWSLQEREDGAILTWEEAPEPRNPVILRHGRYRAPFWWVTGLRHVTATGPQGRARLLRGRPAYV